MEHKDLDIVNLMFEDDFVKPGARPSATMALA